MIHLFFALLLVQDPTPPAQQPPAPVEEPAKQEKPPRSRDDRLEGRIAAEPDPKPAPEVPAPEPPAPEPVKDRLAGWDQINACVLIVNEEPVTLLEGQRGVIRSNRKDANRQQVFNEVIRDRARDLLEIQGGKDLGFEPAAIERLVQKHLERQAELAGSVTQLAAELRNEDINSFQRKEEVSDYVNRMLWEESITGKSPSPGGRVSRDPFIRPGMAMLAQRAAAREQAQARTVQVTQMILRPDGPAGGMERAKKRLEDLRERVVNGEDMGALSEQARACTAGTRGLTGFLNIEGLRAANPDAAEFVDKAQVGDLSPVLNFFVEGKQVGYALVRVEEFKFATAKVDPFDEPKAQAMWFKNLADQTREMRIMAGLQDLRGAAYVWPPQDFRGQAHKAAPAQTP